MQFIYFYYFPYVYIFNLVFFLSVFTKWINLFPLHEIHKKLKAIILIQHIESNTDFFKCLNWPFNFFFLQKKIENGN